MAAWMARPALRSLWTTSVMGLSPSDTVFIAAHAEVEHEDGREEGAWGKGTRFVERGPWAMYFTYEVQAPPPHDLVRLRR